MSSQDAPVSGSEPKPVIVVLEPEVLIRMTIAQFLRDCGYTVIEGVVSADVWTVLEAGVAVHVVFSEVELENSNAGFALARTLRQTHPHVDVILTSGVAAAAEKSKELCEEGPMRKPYHATEVAQRIHRLLERRRSGSKKG